MAVVAGAWSEQMLVGRSGWLGEEGSRVEEGRKIGGKEQARKISYEEGVEGKIRTKTYPLNHLN